MSRRLYSCIFLLIAPTLLKAESRVDFDGRSATENVKSFISKNLFVSTPVLIDTTEPSIKREILTETGEWVELKAIKSWVEADGRVGNEYSVLPGTKLRRAFKCPRRTSKLQEAYNFQNEAGGHFHNEIPTPLLLVSSPSLNASTATFYAVPSPMIWTIQPGVTYYYWEHLPLFATMVVEELSSDICGQWTDILSVEVPGLSAMPKGTDYVLYSSEDTKKYHPYNHYGALALIDAIKSVAREYMMAFPGAAPLQIGDMSLFSGGMFDIKHNWMLPHTGHDFGVEADIGKNTVPRVNRKKLLEISCQHIPGTFLDPDLPGYYHINVSTGKTVIGNVFKKAVRCCLGNEVDPNNIAVCTAD